MFKMIWGKKDSTIFTHPSFRTLFRVYALLTALNTRSVSKLLD